MLGDIQAAKTPLERRVDQLGRQIARWVLALAAALGLVGHRRRRDRPRAGDDHLRGGAGGGGRARRTAGGAHGRPGARRRAHGPAPRRRSATLRRRGARIGHGHCDRQDGHVDREPHGRALARRVRSAARARGHRAGERCGPDDRCGRSARSRPAALCRRARRGHRAAAPGTPTRLRAAVRQRLEVRPRHGAGGRAGW